MKFDPTNPPRKYQAGINGSVTISDCGKVHLAADEQVTFITDSGGEYDVCRKSWGFYATPSLNGRLPQFGLRGALVRNELGRFFVMLVERGKESEFSEYLKGERNQIVTWLDDTKTLESLWHG